LARLWVVVLVAFLFAIPEARANPPAGIEQGSRAEGERLLSLVDVSGRFRLVEATPQGFALALDDGSGRSPGVLRLQRGGGDHMPRFRSRSFSMQVSNFSPDLGVTEQLIRAARVIAAQDGGASENPWVRQPSWDLALVRNIALALAALAVVLAVWRGGRVTWEVRLPHLIPAFIQATLFVYWSLYWPPVRDHAPSILLQIAMAFAADAAFSFARFGSWRVGASPLPVVLSTNLFVWFDPHGVIIGILVAFASKALYRRDGRHVLNPSATGLSVAGLISYVAPGFITVGGLFHMMNMAPNMAELMVLLAIVPQTRFRILPLSIAAVFALRLTDNPAVLRPPIILAVALLATDPSTIPKTDSGKVLFGLLLGFGIVAFSAAMRSRGMTDDFAKVLPIPLANILAPHLDRVGAMIVTPAQGALQRGWDRLAGRGGLLFQRPVPNLVFVIVWLLITITPLRQEKPASFEPALHWNLGTPLVVRDADDVPRCASNPVFCQPFTFAQELALWRQRLRQRAATPSQR
jgi:hypothetical protein